MQTKTLYLREVIPYENNPRNNDMAVDAVVESIRQCGYIAPIVVDENNIILAGHTRLKALKMLGKEKISVIQAVGLTEDQKKKYRLLDNKTSEIAEWDLDMLAQELEGLDFDWDVFSPDQFGEDFSLPDGEKNEICQMTFTLHEKQAKLIESVLKTVSLDKTETYGNTNENGNKLYEVVKEWEEQRK